MEWFANMPLPWVIVIVVALLAIRFSLKKIKTNWAKQIGELAESLALAFALVFLLIRPFFVQAYFIPSPSMIPGLQVNDHLLANKFIYRIRDPKHGEIVVFKSPPALELTEGKKDFIKRVIGVPGDTIEVREGLIFVNGRPNSHTEVRDWFDLPGGQTETDWTRVKFFKDYITITTDDTTRRVSKAEIAKTLGQSKAKIEIRPGVVIRNGRPLDEPYTAEDPDYSYSKVKVPPHNFFVMGDNRDNSKDSHYWGFLDKKYVEGKAMFNFYPPRRIGLIR